MIPDATPTADLPFDICRAARVARDARYDGILFSGARTTKIYCRPICPGKPPLAANQVFFQNSAQAEAAAYRPCLRCRPELAPGHLIRNAGSWKVRYILDRIHQGDRSRDLVDGFGAVHQGALGLFQEVLGACLPEYEQTFQLGFAKLLVTDTALPLSRIAAVSGMGTSRTLVAGLTNRYRKDPSALRKPLPVEPRPGLQSCALNLFHRPPLDWDGLLHYFHRRAIAGVESVAGGVYQRSFKLQGAGGWFSVRPVPGCHAVRLEVHTTDLCCLKQVVWRVRRMLDLDADPMALEAHFQNDPILNAVFRRHPGLRVPVAWDAFEFAVRAVVGQVVSVGAATALMGRIAAEYSQALCLPAPRGIEKLFPGPFGLQQADLRKCGLSRTKADAIAALAREVADERLDIQAAARLDSFIADCTALRGIGDWTARTIAMRGMGDPDAFPAGDLGIVKALSAAGQKITPARIEKIAHAWKPLRAYAAMLLWEKKNQ
jgi:AraC family transcriptional regulator of adaptative response / DNA-3-methyladenine glycosylase II